MTASEWRIERLVPGGDGLARLDDGRVGFARGAFPGDLIAVRQEQVKTGYVRALAWELVAAGPARVEPPCPVASQCGGCNWMALERSAQLHAKAELLQDALTRIGQLPASARALPVVAAGPELRYRNRLRLQVDASGRLGFFAYGTRALVEIPACLLADVRIDRALAELRVLAAKHGATLGRFEAVEIRVAQAGPSPLVVLFFRGQEGRFHGRRRAAAPPRPRVSDVPMRSFLRELGETHAFELVRAPAHLAEASAQAAASAAAPTLAEQTWSLNDGTELTVPATSFVQVNWAVNCALVEAVVRGAQQRGTRRFCDIYCGVGNFSLPLAKAGIAGVGIEGNPESVAAARRAALAQGISNVEFVTQAAASLAAHLSNLAARADLVIVDPPRAGARELILAIGKLTPAHVALCSCDPATLARDVRALVDAGYSVDEVTAFDMFPQTHHVEALVWLRRV